MKAEFVLLEQILPDGEHHPFAATMLSHFRKLGTPLKSIHAYPTLDSQLQRFASQGWNSVHAWTLWQAWADETFLSVADRRRLDEVEPFDEWEEFALFGCHYCLIHARTAPGPVQIAGLSTNDPCPDASAELPAEKIKMRFDECPGQKGQRRFAASMQLPQNNGGYTIVNVMGLGSKSRLQSCDVYSLRSNESARQLSFHEGGPMSRMCHTLTDIDSDNCILLAGGRGSPSDPFKDCWLFDKRIRAWRRTHDLPTPLYRHSVASIQNSSFALLAGGKGSGAAVYDGCLLYHIEEGWIDCEIIGDQRLRPVYGAALICQGVSRTSPSSFEGIFAGGLQDGTITDQILTWQLDVSNVKVRSSNGGVL